MSAGPHMEFLHAALPGGATLVTMDGVEYATTREFTLEWTSNGLGIHTVPPTKAAANECECCHRFDVVEQVASSWEEALKWRWLVTKNEWLASMEGKWLYARLAPQGYTTVEACAALSDDKHGLLRQVLGVDQLTPGQQAGWDWLMGQLP